MNPKTSVGQKFSLIFLGIFFALFSLEVILQAGGGLYLFIQESSNRKSLQKNGEYRILCIGESTTALGGENAYPRQLERILNSTQKEIKFSVINKGIPATTTKYILARVESYLKEYEPQMVVAMMGINDSIDPFYEKRRPTMAQSAIWENLKTYKLILLIQKHLFHPPEKKYEMNSEAEATIKRLEDAAVQANSTVEYTKLALLYRSLNMIDKEKETILKALDLNPANLEAVSMLGYYYKRMGDYVSAIGIFKKMILLSQGRKSYVMRAYEDLAESYKLNNQVDAAIQIYNESLKNFPDHAKSYEGLGDVYLEKEDWKAAITWFEKQIGYDSKAALSYGKLAHGYRQLGRDAESLAILFEGIKKNPQEPKLYAELSYLYLEMKQLEKAIEVLTRGLAINADFFKSAHLTEGSPLLKNYDSSQRSVIINKWNQLLPQRSDELLLETRDNFLKLRQVLDKNRIRFVAAQYPLRPIDALKEIFKGDSNVLFVDNQKIFQEAVARKGYDAIFTDRFANDFGHCTVEGNFLLAQNIAQAIFKSVGK